MFWLEIGAAGDQLRPPSVVFENHGVPRKANEWNSAVRSALSLGNALRSHTAYAVPARYGSAVTDSLSLKLTPGIDVTSRLMVAGSLQVSPPSCDTLARIAESVLSPAKERLTW